MTDFPIKLVFPSEPLLLLDSMNDEQYSVVSLWISNARANLNNRLNISLWRSYYYLHKKVHKWLVENNIQYDIFFQNSNNSENCGIAFKDKKDAMIYKLRWF